MWPYETNTRHAAITRLIGEISIRVALLVAVCVMAILLQPHTRYITPEELLADFKRPRRQSCVPMWVMVTVIIFVPLIFFTLPWLLTKNYMDTTQAILAWTLALSVTGMITEILKLSVGRPRPDFFYRCFPDGIMIISSELQCTGNVRDVIEGRKSFPSGHSSFAFASLSFLSQWICGKYKVLSGNRRSFTKVISCILPLMIASGIAVSRVCDNHHHWGDVLFGSVIGIVVSYICYAHYYNSLGSDLAGTPYILGEPECSHSCTLSCTRNSNYTVGTVKLSDKDISCNKLN